MDYLEQFNKVSPYWELLGMKLLQAEAGYARMIMPVKHGLLQRYGVVHGGAIASLVDSAVAVATYCTLLPGESMTTIELKVNYLAPVKEGQIFAEAKMVKRGKSIAVATVDVTDEEGRQLAFATATYMVIRQDVREALKNGEENSR